MVHLSIFTLNVNVLRRHCMIVEEFMSFGNGSKTSTIANQNFAEKFEGKFKKKHTQNGIVYTHSKQF